LVWGSPPASILPQPALRIAQIVTECLLFSCVLICSSFNQQYLVDKMTSPAQESSLFHAAHPGSQALLVPPNGKGTYAIPSPLQEIQYAKQGQVQEQSTLMPMRQRLQSHIEGSCTFLLNLLEFPKFGNIFPKFSFFNLRGRCPITLFTSENRFKSVLVCSRNV
jgi:hypothetical protein